MANGFRADEEASRALTARLVLRDIKRRQQALRRKWCQVSREELAAELLAIGRTLLDAAPLFFPRAFGFYRAPDRPNGSARSLNGRKAGHLRFLTSTHPSGQRLSSDGEYGKRDAWWHEEAEHQEWWELILWSQRALDDLEDLVRWLQGGRPAAESGQ